MPTVGLDYGHGVNTFPPSKGVYKNGKGYAEHDFNAKLGLEVKKLLQHNGFKVVEGQGAFKNDVPLRTRTNLYNRKKVDIVLSLHANAGAPSASGRCVFYWGTSSKGKRLATMIRDEIRNAGYSTHGNGLHAGVRGTWTDLHMIRATKMPAVLVEHGFMTNSKDFELIFGSKQKQYIQDMAKANVKAVCRYFGKTFKGEGGLTVSQYKELNNKIVSLEKALNSKLDKPSTSQTPNPSHKDNVEQAKALGISNGANPQQYGTREQGISMIMNALNNVVYPNIKDADESHKEAVEWAVEIGLLNGENLHHPATRQQLATVSKRLYDHIVDSLGRDTLEED